MSEKRDDESYREEAEHASEPAPEYRGERLIFDELRADPTRPATAEERAAQGPLAAPVEKAETGAELLGEGVGGASGALAGAAVGALAGPLGAAIGAIAGAVGGWWAGRAVVDAASGISGDLHPAYQLGIIASMNPEYAGRPFEEIEGALERGWTGDARTHYGEWSAVRHLARDGYQAGTGRSAGPPAAE